MDWIEKLAREHGTGGWQTLEDMVRFGKAVAEEEREACARVCEKTINVAGTNVVANRFANAIRLRSNAMYTAKPAI